MCDMGCPQQNNIGAKRTEKMMKYSQIAFKKREQCPGYKVYVVPVVVGALGGGIKALRFDLKKIFENNELLIQNYCYDAKDSINGQRKYYLKGHIWSYPRRR